MPISEEEMIALEAEFEGELDDFMREWEASLQEHFAADEPLQKSADAYDGAEPERYGRWITVGSDKGSDGKNHGGAHVYIEGDGTISKGPESMTGKKVSELSQRTPGKKPEDSKEKPSTTVDKEKDSGKIPSVANDQPKETKMDATAEKPKTVDPSRGFHATAINARKISRETHETSSGTSGEDASAKAVAASESTHKSGLGIDLAKAHMAAADAHLEARDEHQKLRASDKQNSQIHGIAASEHQAAADAHEKAAEFFNGRRALRYDADA